MSAAEQPPRGPTTSARAAAKQHRGGGRGVKSKQARSVALDLLGYAPEQRRSWLATLEERERTFVFAEVARETGSLYGLWHDDPYGFTVDVLDETMWVKQQQIMAAVADPHIKRVVVPAGFGVGKTFLAGRLVAWAGAVNPVGTIKIVTTATRERQVKTQLWPHIKTAVAKGRLPGKTDTMQWTALDQLGNTFQIAYGFSAAPTDEAAMQGIHGVPRLLLVVDEAGGIAPLIGRGTNNLLTGDAKMLAIGNPAMDEPGSWFETLSAEGDDPEEPSTAKVQISTLDSPSITGEPTPVCKACVPNLDGHTIAGGVPAHLPDRDWLRRTCGEYGVIIPPEATVAEIRAAALESGVPYLIAKVLAEFPQGSGNQVMPSSWVEAAELMEDPTGDDYVRLCDLGLEDEKDTFTVKRGSYIKLGVDVASDGGDEFAIYRFIGDVVHQVHASSGQQNADPNAVAERVLAEIDRAERLKKALRSTHQIRVKVDKNGLGWGTVGSLERWGQTGRHHAHIVGVMVSENPEREDPAAVMRPARKRDEMWLAGRFLLQPDPSTGYGRIRLRVDHVCKVQMSNPRLGSNAAGYTTVERKADMKKRGVKSPDRAEAALLALYEPFPVRKFKRMGLLN